MYKSPIELEITRTEDELINKMEEAFEESVAYKITQEYNINVDRDELIKALRYDRAQYEEGYRDGKKLNWRVPNPAEYPNGYPEPWQKCFFTKHEIGWNGEDYITVVEKTYGGEKDIIAWIPYDEVIQPYNPY